MHPAITMRRAYAVIGAALDAYTSKRYPFQNIFLPQDVLSARVRANAHLTALVLFYSCHYMRGTIKSNYALRKIVELQESTPELFVPAHACTLSHAQVRAHLHAMIPYKSAEIATSWIENSRRLTLHWEGDPRVIFLRAKTTDELHRFVANRASVRLPTRTGNLEEDGFLGFQKKMAGMLAYFLESCGLIAPFARETTPPVDFHHLRILVATRVIRFPERESARYEELRPLGEVVYTRYLHKTKARMRELGDALWLISQRLCANSPVTETLNGSLVVPDWGNLATLRRYEHTCGSCPLEAHCAFAVQANAYYKRGYFELNRPRPKPPIAPLYSADDAPRTFLVRK